MKLSQRTLNVLKNFSTISKGIVINPGNDTTQQLIISGAGRKIIAIADVEEHFDNQVSLYDLSQFLSAYTKSKEDVALDFTPTNVVIRMGKATARIPYAYTDLVYEPDKNGQPLPFPDNLRERMTAMIGTPIVEFDLTEKQLTDLLTMGGVLGLDNMTVRPVDGKIVVRMFNFEENAEGESADGLKTYDITVLDEYDGEPFHIDFNLDMLKVITDDYHISLAPKISQWSSKTQALSYFIGTKTTSKYGD